MPNLLLISHEVIERLNLGLIDISLKHSWSYLTRPIIFDTLTPSMNHKITLSLIIAITLFLSVTQPVAAYGYGTYNSYNGSSQSSVIINKTIYNPATKTLVENMGNGDYLFSPKESVTFNLAITNNGTETIKTIHVTDVFPTLVTFTAGPGVYNAATNTVTLDMGELTAGQTRNITLNAKVKDTAHLPSQASSCAQNRATANDSVDTTAFCVKNTTLTTANTTKGGLKLYTTPAIKHTPATGPEMLYMLGAFPALFGGLFLRKKATA